MGLNESQKMDRSEYLENNLIITECSQKVPYAFISYASDNWETVFKTAVVPMQKKYGLRVYADKAFDKVNDKWIVPMLRNVRGSDVMVAFVSQSYIESYACFLELLTAVNNKKQIVFVSLEQQLYLGDTTDQPNVERGVKNEILNQGANIATNTNNSSNDVMRAMKSAYTSISSFLEQDALSKYDITDAFINFFKDASINKKTINDLNAVKRTINSVSSNVFDISLITKPEPAAQPVAPKYQTAPQANETVQQTESTHEPVQQSETEYQPVPQAAEAEAWPAPETPKGIAAKRKIDLHSKKCKTMIAAAVAVCCIVVGGIVIGFNSPKDVIDKSYASDMLKVGGVYAEVTGTYTGRWQKNRPEGEGTLTFNNGSVYSGEWKGGKANGQGTLTYASGDIYEGEYKEGRRDGHGVYTFTDGDVYEGEFKDGMYNGHGVYTYASGSVYDGEWKDDKKEGQGVQTFGEGTNYAGDVYEGEFKDGLYNGHGVYRWTDGRIYEGEWKDDKKDGQGTMTFADGDVYEGEWKDGKYNGHGVYTGADGRVYEGEWKDDKKEGHGVYTYANGDVYDGEWKDDKTSGHGVYTYTSKDDDDNDITITYEGEWKDGKRNGQGVQTWSSGHIYDGEWKDSKYNGQGSMTYPSGGIYTGEWKDGKKDGQGTWVYNDTVKLEVWKEGEKLFTVYEDPDDSTQVRLECETVQGATGYQSYLFEDAEHTKVMSEGSIRKGTIVWGPMQAGQTYYIGVRAVKEENGETTYFDWSYVDYTHNPS